jgi:hypothetical protein
LHFALSFVVEKDQKDLGWEKPKLIQEYSTRKRGAFYSLCESMKQTPTVYKSAMMDAFRFRDEEDPNPSDV